MKKILCRAIDATRSMLGVGPRPAIPPDRQRRPKILRWVNREEPGVEIGPSYSGVATKREGFKVHIIDHLDRADLIEKYRSHRQPLERIEEVDFVWRGEPYAELTGHPHHYQWVIASHLVEHTPDLVGFLLNCDAILREDGVLSLAVPDHRYCFDHFRPPSSLGAVVDAHHARRTRITPGNVAECLLFNVCKGGKIAWPAGHTGSFGIIHSVEQARLGMEEAARSTDYFDHHAWCFTPHSFRLLIHDLHLLGLQPFRECAFFPTSGCEFYITLSRQGAGPDMDRLALMKKARAERRKD